jgi:primosomal protein N' (replication factor Y) (superfamily II helicase)
MKNHFADVILPFAIRAGFTYMVPEQLLDSVRPGVRVLVQLGNRRIFTAIVSSVHDKAPASGTPREILKVLDQAPLVNETQLKLWTWIAEYYMCYPGEVLKAALPSAFFLEGMTSEPIAEKFRPKTETFVGLSTTFTDGELNNILDGLARAQKQYEVMASWLRISGYPEGSGDMQVRLSTILKDSGASMASVRALEKKNILSIITRETGRLENFGNETGPPKVLSSAQLTALDRIKLLFSAKDIVLLHGITSSGKTEIYIHLIDEVLRRGKQVLYLLPEIGLTAQIILRLRKHFGDATGIYHSKFNDAEKVEIYKKVAGQDPSSGYRLILGVRSALFLPFSDLGLVIVDEEQDTSFKQHDPAPRYHARDSAIILAGLHKAKVLLGSASPSIESYGNALSGKYGLVELTERYGKIKLPGIIIANAREARRKKLMVSYFTPELLEAMDRALGNGEQIILFQNRRGFAPYIECSECGWIPKCVQCSVSLTYHRLINSLVCHYCGHSTPMVSRCPSCNSTALLTRGFGTEKIEEEIKIVFPSARVARLDQDTTKGKNSFDKLIKTFEDGKTDILIGTQMISKGLDFENLTVVGILNADNLLNFPDFRAHERSFQMMEQVSGRAGRRSKTGTVIIQTSDPGNRIIRLVTRHDYKTMYRIQAEERKDFNYPPFCRMIRISLKHKNRALLNEFSDKAGRGLRELFGKRVLGPEYPLVSQVQQWYIKTILIKLERKLPVTGSKKLIGEVIEKIEKEKGASALRIAVDVDPY